MAGGAGGRDAVADEDQERRVKTSLAASVKDGILFSLMTGLGDAYMAPLLLFYGAGDAVLITAQPLVIDPYPRRGQLRL